jgi:peroxiredoxin
MKNERAKGNEMTKSGVLGTKPTAASVVVGLFDCDADAQDELSFTKGDLIYVLMDVSPDWFFGRLKRNGKEGLVPYNYVEAVQRDISTAMSVISPQEKAKSYASWRQSVIAQPQNFLQLLQPMMEGVTENDVPLPGPQIKPSQSHSPIDPPLSPSRSLPPIDPSTSPLRSPPPVEISMSHSANFLTSSPNPHSRSESNLAHKQISDALYYSDLPPPLPNSKCSPQHQLSPTPLRSSPQIKSICTTTMNQSRDISPLRELDDRSLIDTPTRTNEIDDRRRTLRIAPNASPKRTRPISILSPANTPIPTPSPTPTQTSTSTSTSTPTSISPRTNGPILTEKIPPSAGITATQQQSNFILHLIGDLRGAPSPLFELIANWWQPPLWAVSPDNPSSSHSRASHNFSSQEKITLAKLEELLFETDVDDSVLSALVLGHSLLMDSSDFFTLLSTNLYSARGVRRIRICSALQRWVELFRSDFVNEEIELMKVVDVLDPTLPHDVLLKDTLQLRERFYKSRLALQKYITQSFRPLRMTVRLISEFPPALVARHLMVFEWSLLSFLSSSDILCGEMTRLWDHFQYVIAWVRRTLHVAKDVSDCVRFFVEVIRESFNYLNLWGIHAILSGLETAGVDVRSHISATMYSDVYSPLEKMFTERSSYKSYRIFSFFVNGRTLCLMSPMILLDDLRNIGRNWGGRDTPIDMSRLMRTFDLFRPFYLNLITIDLRYFELEGSSPFSFPLDASLCASLSLIHAPTPPPPSLQLKDENNLVECVGDFSVESNVMTTPSREDEIFDPVYKREFYDTNPPPMCFAGVDIYDRAFIITVRKYTPTDSSVAVGMAIVFTCNVMGDDGKPMYYIKSLDELAVEDEKILSSELLTQIPDLFRGMSKVILKPLNFTQEIDERLLHLEGELLGCGPHIIGVIRHTGETDSPTATLNNEFSDLFTAFTDSLTKEIHSSPPVGLPREWRTARFGKRHGMDVGFLIAPNVVSDERKAAFESLRTLIVFSDIGSTPFRPSDYFPSANVFILVRPTTNSNTAYQVSVASRANTAYRYPKTPEKPLPTSQLIEFLIEKSIMCERHMTRVVAHLRTETERKRISAIKTLAAMSSQSMPSFSSRRKRASMVLTGVAHDIKTRPVQILSTSPSPSSIPTSVPIVLSDFSKILSVLRPCFLPPPSKVKTSISKEVLQCLPHLSVPLLSDEEEIPFSCPSMKGVIFDAICARIEKTTDYKELIVNPHLLDISDTLTTLTDANADAKLVHQYPPRRLAGVLKLWFTLNRTSVIPDSVYNSLIRLVSEEMIGPQSATKFHIFFQSIPPVHLSVLERVVRMCSYLSAGSVMKSSALAEQFSGVLFIPPKIQTDLLFKIQYQKRVLQYLIDHHSACFHVKGMPSLVLPTLLSFDQQQNTAIKVARAEAAMDKQKGSKIKAFRRTLTISTKLASRKSSGGSTGDVSRAYAKIFSLRDNFGKKVSIADIVASGSHCILFFFVKDGGVWRRVLKLMKANYEILTACGAQLFGISPNEPDANASYVQSLRLPFRLLSDPTGRTRQKFGVHTGKNMTFVLNSCGEITHSYDSSDATSEHLLNAFAALLVNLAGYYFATSSRIPSPQFQYFYSIEKLFSATMEEQKDGDSMRDWGVDAVGDWLQSKGLDDLCGAFEENAIKGVDLLELTVNELEDELELRGHPLLPTLIAEMNILRVTHAKGQG